MRCSTPGRRPDADDSAPGGPGARALGHPPPAPGSSMRLSAGPRLCDAGGVRRLIGLLGVALAALLGSCASPPGAIRADGVDSPPSVPGYRLVADVPLTGGASRWGYPVLDARAGRLYLAHP